MCDNGFIQKSYQAEIWVECHENSTTLSLPIGFAPVQTYVITDIGVDNWNPRSVFDYFGNSEINCPE